MSPFELSMYLALDAKCNVKMTADDMTHVLPPDIDFAECQGAWLTIDMNTGAVWYYKDVDYYLASDGKYHWCFMNKVMCAIDFTARTIEEMMADAVQKAKRVKKEILIREIREESEHPFV